jgi:hypothetical protein
MLKWQMSNIHNMYCVSEIQNESITMGYIFKSFFVSSYWTIDYYLFVKYGSLNMWFRWLGKVHE